VLLKKASQNFWKSWQLDKTIAISGIFFLYKFLVRDSGKQALFVRLLGNRQTNMRWIAAPVLVGAGVFRARRNSRTGPFGRLSGTGKGSSTPEPEGRTPVPDEARGLASLT
jgi:hypothetical protein